MYRNTTPWQLIRALGTWLLGLGVLVVPFLLHQIANLTEPRIASYAAAVLVAGILAFGGGAWAIRRLDAQNRPLLFAPNGYVYLRGREDFEARVVTFRGWMLAGTIVVGALFVIVVSLHSCGDRVTGVCGFGRPSFEATLALRTVALSFGIAYVACSILRGVQSRETERLAQLVEEGRKQRRAADPFAGTRRDRWEFD